MIAPTKWMGKPSFTNPVPVRWTVFSPWESPSFQDAALLIAAAKTLGGALPLWADGCAARAAVCALALSEDVQSACVEGAALAEGLTMPGIRTLGDTEGYLKLVRCPVERF